MQQGGHDQTFRLLVFMVSTTVENGNRDKGILKVSVAMPRQWSAEMRHRDEGPAGRKGDSHQIWVIWEFRADIGADKERIKGTGAYIGKYQIGGHNTSFPDKPVMCPPGEYGDGMAVRRTRRVR